jgi:hypothetical protein
MTLITTKRLKIDMMAEMDRITSTYNDIPPWALREEIGNTFRRHAQAAGWDFMTETWPVLKEAIGTSINSTPEEEVIHYIEYLGNYCSKGE